MVCYYHPERESTDICAICGKEICKECGLEIAGKIYCKECLQKIVGLSLDTQSQAAPSQEPASLEPASPEPARPEPVRLEKQPVENIYDPQEEVIYNQEPQEFSRKISEDSPYNVRDNIQYTGGPESSYLSEKEKPPLEKQPQIAQNEVDYYPEEQIQQQPVSEPEYIYPDHSYEPETTSARMDLEDKYEKYLDDLYFDENEVPLGEQLAKDEEQYGSLTKKPYQPPKTPPKDQKRVQSKPKRPETPEEMEARIRNEILQEQGIKVSKDNKNIHNLNYQEEKEPMGVIDILLSIILVIVILIVIYYLIYLFILHSSYPTFMDAVFGLKNPQNVINSMLSGGGKSI